MSIREALEAIYDREGFLTPALVLEEARPETSPLHGYVFSKEVQEAAESWYLSRAQRLIRMVKVTYREPTATEPEVRGRLFQPVRSQGDSGKTYTYVRADEIARDPIASELVIREMNREWRRLYDRYAGFQEFSDLVQKDLGGQPVAAAG